MRINLIKHIIFLVFFSFHAVLTAQNERIPVYLKFHSDKVYILDNQKVEFSASVFVGTPEVPVSDIYAIAFDIVFDSDLVIADSTSFVYNTQSFLGSGNEIAVSQKAQGINKGKLNVVISRQNGKNVSGFGEIGTVRFVTIHDIIGSREIEEVPFNGRIEPLRLLNAAGQQLPFEADSDGDNTLLINDILARSAQSMARNVEIYPNPASDRLYINIRSLHGEYLEVFNAQGQRVSMEPIRSDYIQLATDHFQPGIYLIRIRAEEGILTKRVLINK